MRGILLTLLALAVPAVALPCLPAGCAPAEEPETEPSEDAGGPKAEMRTLLQAAADAADARPAGEVTWYSPENLYDYINGQAEQFRDAGFVALAHAEYRAKDAAGDAFVEVDLYRMASAEAARTVMTPPPPDDAVDLAPGVQAYRAETLCEFAAGPYYVRIVPRLDAAGQAGLVGALARRLATEITSK
ncbi:MAG: DUF6599 family protein [Phycisphaerae bacterium]